MIILADPRVGYARILTGIDVLDNDAITIRRPADVLLEAIAFAGNRLIAAGEHGVIIYSDDCGATWSQASVPVDVTLTCIGFATPNVGWAAGHFGVVLKTIDAGKNWKIQLNGFQVNKLTMLAAQQANAQTRQSPAYPLALRRAEIFGAVGADKPFFSLSVLDSENVVVFGAYRMTMKTTDGGKSWSDWSLNIWDPLSHNLYAASRVGSDIYLVGEAGSVFLSNDSGNTFVKVTSPSEVTLIGLVCPQDRGLIVFGVAGSCFRSLDSGKSWVAIDLGTQDNISSGLIMKSGQILIASQTGRLFVSNDNGLTFGAVPGQPAMSIFGMEETQDMQLVFVGGSGVTKLPASIAHS